MPQLFAPLNLRSITLRNRIAMSPMCMYSCAANGLPTDWHVMHLGARAAGGCSLVFTEATAVEARGRISACDCGLWSAEQTMAWQPITAFIKAQGAQPGMQLAHAGRKAGTAPPWDGGRPYLDVPGGWTRIAPSALAFAAGYPLPMPMSSSDLDEVEFAWTTAAERAQTAGFTVLELHMAHGYLLHQFLSPLTNQRTDEYGGSLENRMRFPLRVATAVRQVWPEDLPLFVRLSCTDWVDGGWDLPQAIAFSLRLRQSGVDVIDCSSGGAVPDAKVPVAPGYQIQFSEAIRQATGPCTAAVGLITAPAQAEEIVRNELADIVVIGRELLRNPHWPLHAAQELSAETEWPRQYLRAR